MRWLHTSKHPYQLASKPHRLREEVCFADSWIRATNQETNDKQMRSLNEEFRNREDQAKHECINGYIIS